MSSTTPTLSTPPLDPSLPSSHPQQNIVPLPRRHHPNNRLAIIRPRKLPSPFHPNLEPPQNHRHKRHDGLLRNEPARTHRLPAAKRPPRRALIQLRMIHKPAGIETFNAGAKDVLVEVQLTVRDHDAPAFTQDETVDGRVARDVAHRGGEGGQAQGFEPGSREEGTVLGEVGDVGPRAGGEGRGAFGAEEGDEVRVVGDVG